MCFFNGGLWHMNMSGPGYINFVVKDSFSAVFFFGIYIEMINNNKNIEYHQN